MENSRLTSCIRFQGAICLGGVFYITIEPCQALFFFLLKIMRKAYDKILDRLLYFAIIGMIVVAVMTITSVFHGCGFPKKHICNSKCTPKAKKVVSQPIVKWDQCQTW